MWGPVWSWAAQRTAFAAALAPVSTKLCKEIDSTSNWRDVLPMLFRRPMLRICLYRHPQRLLQHIINGRRISQATAVLHTSLQSSEEVLMSSSRRTQLLCFSLQDCRRSLVGQEPRSLCVKKRINSMTGATSLEVMLHATHEDLLWCSFDK